MGMKPYKYGENSQVAQDAQEGMRMDFTSHDVVVIEQALRIAMNHETKDSKMNEYREVLSKLQNKAEAAMLFGSKQLTSVHDGLRYDYDDSSDLL